MDILVDASEIHFDALDRAYDSGHLASHTHQLTMAAVQRGEALVAALSARGVDPSRVVVRSQPHNCPTLFTLRPFSRLMSREPHQMDWLQHAFTGKPYDADGAMPACKPHALASLYSAFSLFDTTGGGAIRLDNLQLVLQVR